MHISQVRALLKEKRDRLENEKKAKAQKKQDQKKPVVKKTSKVVKSASLKKADVKKGKERKGKERLQKMLAAKEVLQLVGSPSLMIYLATLFRNKKGQVLKKLVLGWGVFNKESFEITLFYL